MSVAANTDPNVANMAVRSVNEDAHYGWLITSPEFHMKRLLAARSGPIFQVCRVFRSGECGHLHNPEFSLLEWYRPGFSAPRLMREVEELVAGVLDKDAPAGPTEHVAYAEACLAYAGIDPLKADHDDLLEALCHHGVDPGPGDTGFNEHLDLLMGSVVAPNLGRGGFCFVTDYPADQAALARLKEGHPKTADRFELYWQGIELANGYRELTDPDEQAARFRKDNEQRCRKGIPPLSVDENLLEAMRHGLPDCSGVALGLDRLLMLKLERNSVREVLSFPWIIT